MILASPRPDFFSPERGHRLSRHRIGQQRAVQVNWPNRLATERLETKLHDWPEVLMSVERNLELLCHSLADADKHLQALRVGYDSLYEAAHSVTHTVEGPLRRLTDRERRVAMLAACGQGDRQIAASLNVSINTVKTQMKSVLAKIGIRSRWQLKDVISLSERNIDTARALSPVERFSVRRR
jgi:DNA-binding CsgD family transcriptional regulator